MSFLVGLILARLLLPEHYGTIALITVFTGILNVFIDSGMGQALIQKAHADNLDYSSLFYFNIVMSITLYTILFLCAPLIAQFYNDPTMIAPVRAIGVTLLIAGVRNIQQAYVSKNMLFKRFFYTTLSGTLASAIVGIAMAYMGYGIWALVAQTLVSSAVGTIVLFFTVRWRPQWAFSFQRLKGLFSYGWKLLVSSLFHTIYLDLRQLVIGKLYSSADLAYYNRGNHIPRLVVNNINSSIDSVIFPAMSSAQEDPARVKQMTRRAIQTSSFIMWPLMLTLFVVSEPLVRLLLTEKWLSVVPFMQISCVCYAFQPIHTANLNTIKAMGRSDIFLKLEIIKKVFGLLLLLAVMRYGVLAIALSLIFYNVVAQILNSSPNKKLVGYSYLEQLKDILPFILLASATATAAYYAIRSLQLNDLLTIILQATLTLTLYIASAKLFRLEIMQYVVTTAKETLSKRKK